jgi:ribosomal protein S18 acetylase RimI-like enzyme
VIRKRIPAVDDPVIFRLVVQQLLPKSRVDNAAANASPKSIRARLNRNYTLVTAKGTRAPFGFITMNCKDRFLLIDMLALDERYQGRGWGSALMAAAEDYGKKKGCREVRLFVDEVNEKAYRFYAAKGYNVMRYEPIVKCYLLSKTLV